MMHGIIRPALLACAAVVALAGPRTVTAQELSDAEVKAVIEAARSEMRASREQLLAVNLGLSSEEADRFWPLYREYSAKKAALGDDRLKIIMDYATAYPDVSDATAKSLVDRHVKYSKSMNSLKDRYVGKFGKVLPPAKLMRFLQMESRLDNLVELQVQRSIPVVEPAS